MSTSTQSLRALDCGVSLQVPWAEPPLRASSSPDPSAIGNVPKEAPQGRTVVRDHRKLRAFELADQLALIIYQVTRSFPKEELFGLTSQIRRAAVSVPSNIVEGCARNTQVDYLRFLDTAYGSVRELEYQLSLAMRLGLLPDETGNSISSISQETGKVLYGLIRSMRQAAGRHQEIAAEGRSA